MENEYLNTLEILKEHGQEHLLRFYDELSDAEKSSLTEQIKSVDWSLLSLKKEDTAAVHGKIEPLGAMTLSEIDKRHDEFEQAGIEALKNGKIAAVLLAGGQGTRLGWDGPKGTYNVGITHDLYIFECLINNMLDTVKACGRFFPLCIMTSDKNNDETIAFLKAHNFFGYDLSKVFFFKQDMAPSIDFNGKLYLEDKGRLSLSPNGNGGWFNSLKNAGLLDMLKDEGVEWISIFAVDNVLQRINDPAFVGATLLSGTVCGAKVIRKNAPDERIGVLCLEDGSPSIVEYYETTEEIRDAKDENGEPLYPFGVTLNYLYSIAELERICEKPLKYHIVEKKIPYIDENGIYVKPDKPNGKKFEQLAVDLIHAVRDCLPYEIVREREFAPIKNPTGIDSVESARELLKLNGVEL